VPGAGGAVRLNPAPATSAPVHAVRTLTAPVTSSLPAVRGFRASTWRSITRLAAIAKVRAATMATVMRPSTLQSRKPRYGCSIAVRADR
jgi:hypothetical protein